MPFKFTKLTIPEVILIEPSRLLDERGFFMETYKRSDFAKEGITEYFVQDNHSLSRQGVLRGLHYQKNPRAQGKLVRCVKGKIFDVAVDIRRDSPTYGLWVAAKLIGENGHMLYIPSSFAHGFVVLSDVAEVIYKCTEEYSPENERGIICNDPTIIINWPIENPKLSKKDAMLPSLQNADHDFRCV